MNQIKTTLNTHDIKCHGCASAARAALAKLPGVQQIDVDLPGQTVTVTHDQQINRADVAGALTAAGFPSA
jgi:copper chaperone CopZ